MSRTGGAVVVLAIMVGACSSKGSRPTFIETASYPPTDPTVIGPAAAPPEAGSVSPSCSSSADCMSGQVCCVLITSEMNCQAGPCPNLPPTDVWRGGPFQRCATAAECFTTGDTCGIYTTAVIPGLLPGWYSCNPPTDDGGTTEEGGVDAVDSSIVDSTGDGSADAGTSDAPAGG